MVQQEKVTEGPAMSVSVSVRTPKIKGRRRQRLSPVRELRVMERLPHSERRMQQSSKPKTVFFMVENRRQGGGVAVDGVVGLLSVLGRRQGVNWDGTASSRRSVGCCLGRCAGCFC